MSQDFKNKPPEKSICGVNIYAKLADHALARQPAQARLQRPLHARRSAECEYDPRQVNERPHTCRHKACSVEKLREHKTCWSYTEQ